MKNINEKLEDLYLKHWSKMSIKLEDILDSDEFKIKPTNPLLLSHFDPEKYQNSDVKIMILGQENNDWEGVFGKKAKDIAVDNQKHLLKTCSTFYKGEYFEHYGYYRDHFNLIIRLLKQKFEGKLLGFCWSNVIKIGKAHEMGLPPKYILDVIENDFNVFKEELEIIKPDVIIFLSGPNYDKYIKMQIPKATFETVDGYANNVLAKVNIPEVKNAFRTYHPGYLNRKKKDFYGKVYQTIIEQIKL